MAHIKRMMSHDIAAFEAMAKCGHISQAHFAQVGVGKSRIGKYMKEGLVKRVSWQNRGKSGVCYKLTDAGKDFFKARTTFRDFYNAQSGTHDLAIADKYFSLSSEERESFLTEKQARDMFRDHLHSLRSQDRSQEADYLAGLLKSGQISAPDALYRSGDRLIAFEVVTNSYGRAEIAAKVAFVETIGADTEFVRV